MDAVVTQAHKAIIEQEWSAVRLLLHPYLHWTDGDGVTVRGRTRVLEHLERDGAPADRPTAYSLRDGQIYRWRV